MLAYSSGEHKLNRKRSFSMWAYSSGEHSYTGRDPSPCGPTPLVNTATQEEILLHVGLLQ